jgi:hypothetical protein
MATLDSLPPDQRAVLQMVLQRGRSYGDIAAMLSIERSAVRRRALDAFDALGPTNSIPSPQRALLTDYLLGQLPARAAEEVREQLGGTPPGRAWARVVSAQISSLARAPLPEIPVGSSWRQGPAEEDPPVGQSAPESDLAGADVGTAPITPEGAELAEQDHAAEQSQAPPEIGDESTRPTPEALLGSGAPEPVAGSGATPAPPQAAEEQLEEPAEPRREERAAEPVWPDEPTAAGARASASHGRTPLSGGQRRPSSRRGGALLLVLLAVILIAVVLIVALSRGSGASNPNTTSRTGTTSTSASTPTSTSTSTPTSTPTSTSTTTATTTTTTAPAANQKVLSSINLYPPTATKGVVGVAQLLQAGKTLTLVIVAQGVPANTKSNAYAVWLYNSPSSEDLLGFDDTRVGSSGRLQVETTRLPSNLGIYKQLLVTIETVEQPKVPGQVVLKGAFTVTTPTS